jgi:hypothetical protein
VHGLERGKLKNRYHVMIMITVKRSARLQEHHGLMNRATALYM